MLQDDAKQDFLNTKTHLAATGPHARPFRQITRWGESKLEPGPPQLPPRSAASGVRMLELIVKP